MGLGRVGWVGLGSAGIWWCWWFGKGWGWARLGFGGAGGLGKGGVGVGWDLVVLVVWERVGLGSAGIRWWWWFGGGGGGHVFINTGYIPLVARSLEAHSLAHSYMSYPHSRHPLLSSIQALLAYTFPLHIPLHIHHYILPTHTLALQMILNLESTPFHIHYTFELL